MKKLIISFLLALLLIVSMPISALALSAPTISSDADTGQTVFEGEGTPGESVSILVEKNTKRYYLFSQYVDEDGHYTFETKLPKNMEFDGLLNVGGEKVKFPVSTKTDGDDGGEGGDEDNDKFEITLSIDKKTIHKGYVIKPTKVKVTKGETVWDVLKRELEERNISYKCSFSSKYNSMYLESLDGDGEFDHGSTSGWMYCVNGNYPNYGASRYFLEADDIVKWRYTTNLGVDLGVDNSKWGSPESDKKTGEFVKVKPDVDISNNTATSTVTKSEATKAIKELKEKELREFIIEPNIKKDVDKIVVKLPKSAVKDLEEDTDAAVTVKSNVAKISIPNKALKSISSENGSNVSITAEKVDITTLSDENKKLVGNKPVFNFKIDVDGKEVKNFDDKIKVSLPYAPRKDENTENLTVYYIDNNGKAVEMESAHYDSKSTSVVFETDHFSTFAIVYNEKKIEFEDVKKDDWFYSYVQFAVNNKLFNGTSETKFSPNNQMTRSMLVTVLYRMEGEPDVATENTFKDVEVGKWYSDAVVWASANNIISGYSNELFGTNDSTTREQIAAILYRYVKSKGYDVKASTDLSIYDDKDNLSDWAVEPMKWAVSNKIINGRSTTTLEPKGTATRAEVAAVFMRLINKIKV